MGLFGLAVGANWAPCPWSTFFFAHKYKREHVIPLLWVEAVTLFMESELEFDFLIGRCFGFICVNPSSLLFLPFHGQVLVGFQEKLSAWWSWSSSSALAPGSGVTLSQCPPERSQTDTFPPLFINLVPSSQNVLDRAPPLVPTPSW